MVRSPDVSQTTEKHSGFVYSDGGGDQKAWIIRKNHQQGPFDVKMSHEEPRALDVIHRQTHAAKQDKCVQTPAYNIARTIRHFFFFWNISNKSSAELFQKLSVRQRFIAFPTSQCVKSKRHVMCFALQDKTGHFLLIMQQKGRLLHLFPTNAGRGCCYLQPIFSTVKSITAPPSLSPKGPNQQQIWNSERHPRTLCKSIIRLRHHAK